MSQRKTMIRRMAKTVHFLSPLSNSKDMKNDSDDFKLKRLGDFLGRPALMLLGWDSIEKLESLITCKVIEGQMNDEGNYLTSWAWIKLAIFIQELNLALQAAYLDCLLKGIPFNYDEAAMKYLLLKTFGEDITKKNLARLIPVEED